MKKDKNTGIALTVKTFKEVKGIVLMDMLPKTGLPLVTYACSVHANPMGIVSPPSVVP